jgi:hypothetical protein
MVKAISIAFLLGIWASGMIAMAGPPRMRAWNEPLNQTETGSVNAQAPDSNNGAVEKEATEEFVTLPPGTEISVRLADTVNSNRNHTGEQFSGTVDPSVLLGDEVVIPRGTEAQIRLMENKKGGRLHAHAEFKVELVSMIINGRKVDVESNSYDKKKSVLAAKVKGSGRQGADAAAGEAVNGPSLDFASPVIAAFRAAKVEKPAGSKIVFTLAAPFTFEKPPISSKP